MVGLRKTCKLIVGLSGRQALKTVNLFQDETEAAGHCGSLLATGALLFGVQITTYALPVHEKPGSMTTDADNPCLNIEQGSLAFYQALLANHKQAWECLYISAFRSFVPYARQRSAISTDDALDILQEGMAEFSLKLTNGKYSFQGRPVAAYVFTVCRNRWVSFLRKNHIQKVETSQEDIAEESDSLSSLEPIQQSFRFVNQDDTDQEDPEAGSSGGDAIWEDTEVDWEAVSRAFSEVSEDCRTMLHCFYVDEKPLGECGARIGLQENSAKVKRFRCAQRMKALYSQYKRN